MYVCIPSADLMRILFHKTRTRHCKKRNIQKKGTICLFKRTAISQLQLTTFIGNSGLCNYIYCCLRTIQKSKCVYAFLLIQDKRVCACMCMRKSERSTPNRVSSRHSPCPAALQLFRILKGHKHNQCVQGQGPKPAVGPITSSTECRACY